MTPYPFIAIFISYGVFNGLLFILVLYFQKDENKKANLLLALLIFSFTSLLFQHCLEAFGWYKYVPHLIYVTSTFYFLIGPMIYFYFISLINPKRKFKWKDLYHLIPAIIVLVSLLDFYQLEGEFKSTYVENFINLGASAMTNDHVAMVISYKVLFLVYLVFSIRRLKIFIKTYKDIHSNNAIQYVELLKQVSLILIIYISFSLFSALFLVINKELFYFIDYGNLILISLFINFNLVSIIRYPKRYISDVTSKDDKYKASKLDKVELSLIKKNLINLMEKDTPYLNANLKITHLSESLNVSSHHLSQVINSQFNMNFYDFINLYRINSAKKRLDNKDHELYSLQAIAEDSGFNNYVSFYRVFKKIENLTPSEYLK